MALLQSCAKPVSPQENYPESLKIKAAPLQPFKGTTADDLVGNYIQCTGAYYALANEHNGLVNAINK